MNTPKMKKSELKSAWQDFAETVFATAKMMNTFGFEREAGIEYARILAPKCGPDQAARALRDLAAETERLPAPSEILDSIRTQRMVSGTLYLKSESGFCYSGTSMDGKFAEHAELFTSGPRRGRPTGAVRLYTMTCGCARCEAVRECGADPHKNPGPLVHWSACPEGREFAALWEKIAGSKLSKSLREISGGQGDN